MSLTKREAAVISAYTGYTLCNFGAIHEYIEEILERPVMTHEMASEALSVKIREAAKSDFMAICAAVTDDPVETVSTTS